MRVVVASSIYPPLVGGGGARSAAELVAGLCRLPKIDVEVLTVHDGPPTVRRDANGVRVHCLPPDNLYWSRHASRQSRIRRGLWHLRETANPAANRTAQYVADHVGPDVVHFRNIEDYSPIIFRRLASRGIATVQTLNAYSMIEPSAVLYRSGPVGRLSMRLASTLMLPKRHFSHDVTAVVGVSHATLGHHLRRGFYRGVPATVIHTGSRTQADSPPRPRRVDRLVFGFMGTFHPSKGIDELIAAMSHVDRPSIELRIAGDSRGDYGRACRRAAADDPRVRFVGFQDSDAFLRQIDVLVIPSVFPEPYPRVLVEAFAAGVPVIASDRGGTSEGITHGTNGWVYQSHQELSRLITRSVDDPASIERLHRSLRQNPPHHDDEAAMYLTVYQAARRRMRSTVSAIDNAPARAA